MRKFISWPHFLAFAVIVLLVAWFLNQGFGTGFWVTAAVVAVLVLINGIVAAIEDDQAGGFNSSDSESKDE